MPPIWMGFWAQNSLKEGLFFGRFSLHMGELSRNCRKESRVGSFQPKPIIKVGMMASFSN